MRFANALHLASCRGRPTDYTTFTCNPKWPEISEALAEHETAAMRPDIIARVFRAKLRVFVERYKRGRYHGGRNCFYIIVVIEFQWRESLLMDKYRIQCLTNDSNLGGLPHAHIVAAFEGGNDSDYLRHYCTEMPADHNSVHYAAAAKHMHHKCDYRCREISTGRCKNHFPRPLRPSTTIDHSGFVQWKCTNEADSRLVCHLPDAIVEFDCHINVSLQHTYAYMQTHIYAYSHFPWQANVLTRLYCSQRLLPLFLSSLIFSSMSSSALHLRRLLSKT